MDRIRVLGIASILALVVRSSIGFSTCLASGWARAPLLSMSAASMPPSPIVLGLIGGIASGKSSVSEHLKNLGASIIDADKLGHQSYAPGTKCLDSLVQEFGKGIIGDDQAIDRRALGSIVFASPDNRKKLEAIVWPEIRKLAEGEIERLKGQPDTKCVVLEVGGDPHTSSLSLRTFLKKHSPSPALADLYRAPTN
ncbi:unnamed protein product [Chrysoparadoxa australica]